LKVLVTGSCGYVGSLLCPQLLAEGYEVVGYDTQWFGDGFWSHSNEHAKLIKGDIRDDKHFTAAALGCDAVIHLACISNDTCCQLDEALSTRINYDAFEPLVVAAKAAGVRRFIYCSSSSVYGVSHEPDVTEDHPLIPLTLYNKYKGMCEPLLLKHQSEDFECVIIRPATVCGYAPRQRFDLTVNVMTRDAIMKKKITVFGGEQKRPNLHIKDMCDVYKLLLTAPKNLVNGQTFNVGAQNMKVKDIARLIQEVVQDEMGFLVEIETQPSTDNRSYHINSEKIFHALGFRPKRTVEDAIRDLCIRFESGQFKDALSNPWYTNILQLIEKKVA
jgi:nucleoside-diphosphate-sugar epimerase